MYHVLKDDSLPYLQLMVETPQSHIVAAQAGVSSKAIDVRARIAHLRSTHCRLIGHLQTIRHVARKANVENGGTNAAVSTMSTISELSTPVCQVKRNRAQE